MARRRREDLDQVMEVCEVLYGGSGSESEDDVPQQAPPPPAPLPVPPPPARPQQQQPHQRFRLPIPPLLRPRPMPPPPPPRHVPVLLPVPPPPVLPPLVQPPPPRHVPVPLPAPPPPVLPPFVLPPPPRHAPVHLPAPPPPPPPVLPPLVQPLPPPAVRQAPPSFRMSPAVFKRMEERLEELQQEKQLDLANRRPELIPMERRKITFAVPVPSAKRKIEVLVPPFSLSHPDVRPSEHLPVHTQYLPNDRCAPQVVVETNHSDFKLSRKLGGHVHFSPANDWPENTARICLFYFFGTQNSGKWLRSEFATVDVDLNNRNEDGSIKEVSTKFIFSMDKAYAIGPSGKLSSLIRKEQVGIVAVACAGATIIRGDETVFDYDLLAWAERELRIDDLTRLVQAQGPSQQQAAAAAPALPQHPFIFPAAPPALPSPSAAAAVAAPRPHSRP